MDEAVALVTGTSMLGPNIMGVVELSLCTGAGKLGRIGPVEAAGVEVWGATHFVQIVETTVLKTVDTVWLV